MVTITSQNKMSEVLHPSPRKGDREESETERDRAGF